MGTYESCFEKTKETKHVLRKQKKICTLAHQKGSITQCAEEEIRCLFDDN